MMAVGTPIAGKVSKLRAGTGSSLTPVLGRVDMTLNLEKGEIDGSHMDSGDWSDYLQGRKSASIDFTLRALFDEDGEQDPGQVVLIDNYFASQATEVFLDVEFEQRAGHEFKAKAFVSSLTLPAADEAVQDISGTLRITGPVTPANDSGGDNGGDD